MKNSYSIEGETVSILIKREKYDDISFTVSVSDFEKVKAIKGTWGVHYGSGGKLYVKTRIIRTEQTLLHRFLTGGIDETDVDHIDGNSLNNTRENLRVVSHEENCRNRVRANKNNKTTGVKNVRNAANGRYTARVKRNYRIIHLGVFDTVHEAENAVLSYNAS